MLLEVMEFQARKEAIMLATELCKARVLFTS
jgi:hypothetical protein